MELRSVAYNPAGMAGMQGMMDPQSMSMQGMMDAQGMSGMQGMQNMQGMQSMQGMGMMDGQGMAGMQGMGQGMFDPCCTMPMPCPAPCPPPCPPPCPAPEPPSHCVYVVRSGDTVYKIARRFGTTMQAIILANDLRNPDLIYPGQILFIPGASC